MLSTNRSNTIDIRVKQSMRRKENEDTLQEEDKCHRRLNSQRLVMTVISLFMSRK